jgi:glycosyltransferase involved in cell wall biosynthesis
VPLNDRQAFTKFCQRLIDNADLRKQIGAHNLKAVEEFYIDHCAKRYEQLYEKVIANKNG